MTQEKSLLIQLHSHILHVQWNCCAGSCMVLTRQNFGIKQYLLSWWPIHKGNRKTLRTNRQPECRSGIRDAFNMCAEHKINVDIKLARGEVAIASLRSGKKANEQIWRTMEPHIRSNVLFYSVYMNTTTLF